MGHKKKKPPRVLRFVTEGSGAEGVPLPEGTSLVFRVINGTWWAGLYDRHDNRITHAATFNIDKTMEQLVDYVRQHPSEVRRGSNPGGKLSIEGGDIGPVAQSILSGATNFAGVELVGVYPNPPGREEGKD